MRLSKNRKLRKKWIWRRFIINPRNLAKRRKKILSTLISVSKRNGIQPEFSLRRRCKKIARFILMEEIAERRESNIEIAFAIFSVVFQLVLIPLGVYIKYADRISSGWSYLGGFLLMFFILPFILLIPKMIISILVGNKLDSNSTSRRLSHFMANVSWLILFTKLYLHFELPYWLLAGVLSYASLYIQTWVLAPIIKALYKRLRKTSIRSYPFEKSIHILAELSEQLYRINLKKRSGSLSWRNKICFNLDLLSTVFSKYIKDPFNVETIETKAAFLNRCQQIANHWKSLEMKVYFSDSKSIPDLLANFDSSFVAMMEHDLGKLELCYASIPLRRGIKSFTKRVLPSFILLVLWVIIFYFCRREINEAIANSLWFVFGSLSVTSVLNYFNSDLDKDFNIISNIQTITKSFGNR